MKLKLENINFGYDQEPIIKNVSLEINEFNFITIIGENASGKSTLGKIMAGILKPDSGHISYNNHFKTVRKAIVFQNPDNQFVKMKVEDDLVFGMENLNIDQPKIAEQLSKIVAEFELEQLLSKTVHELSGGEKQMVSIISNLLVEPQILILDEALDMMDSKKREKFLLKLFDYSLKHDAIIIYITHDINHAYRSQYIVQVDDGQITNAGTPQTFFETSDQNQEIPLLLSLERKLKAANVNLQLPKDLI